MHLSFKLNSMLVLFLCIASQDVISNADSKLKRYYFPFCFLCPMPLLYLALNSSGYFWQKNTGVTKITRFFQSELTNVKNWHHGWPKVLDMVQSKLQESHKSILHQLLLHMAQTMDGPYRPLFAHPLLGIINHGELLACNSLHADQYLSELTVVLTGNIF